MHPRPTPNPNQECALMAKANRKPTKQKPATQADYAKATFEPWESLTPPLKPGELFPTGHMVNRFTPIARIAYAMNLKSKDELVAMFADRKQWKMFDQLFWEMAEAIKYYREIARMVDVAQTRFLIAASAADFAMKKRGRK